MNTNIRIITLVLASQLWMNNTEMMEIVQVLKADLEAFSNFRSVSSFVLSVSV